MTLANVIKFTRLSEHPTSSYSYTNKTCSGQNKGSLKIIIWYSAEMETTRELSSWWDAMACDKSNGIPCNKSSGVGCQCQPKEPPPLSLKKETTTGKTRRTELRRHTIKWFMSQVQDKKKLFCCYWAADSPNFGASDFKCSSPLI